MDLEELKGAHGEVEGDRERASLGQAVKCVPQPGCPNVSVFQEADRTQSLLSRDGEVGYPMAEECS